MAEAIDYQSGPNSAWSTIATFVPDDLVERGGVKNALGKSQYDAAGILGKLVFYAIMLFVLSAAFGVFGPNPISDHLRAAIAHLPLVFVAILVVAAAIAVAVKGLIQNSLSGLSYGKTLANAASAVILALGVIAALGQLHVAENVVNAVLYATLAGIVGVVIVAVGGGGIRTLSQRWGNIAASYDAEKPLIAEAARTAPSVKQHSQQAERQAQQYTSDGGGYIQGASRHQQASGAGPEGRQAHPGPAPDRTEHQIGRGSPRPDSSTDRG